MSSQKKLTRKKKDLIAKSEISKISEATAICSEKQLAEYRDINKAVFLSFLGTPETWENT